MNWRDHSRLTGKHALLGASNYHWLNYDADRLTNAVLNIRRRNGEHGCTHLQQSALI